MKDTEIAANRADLTAVLAFDAALSSDRGDEAVVLAVCFLPASCFLRAGVADTFGGNAGCAPAFVVLVARR